MKKYIIFLFFSSFLGCKNYNILQKKESILPKNSNYNVFYCENWKRDSIGDLRSRAILISSLKFYKSLVGENWANYSQCFGKPNHFESNPAFDYSAFYYRYTNYKDNSQNKVGDAFFIILVDSKTNKIIQTNTQVWE